MSISPMGSLKQGTVLEDKWIIMELIGKGAMGEVYRAHQTNLKRDVAIKVISQEVMAEIEEDPEELDIAFGRFQREVQTMAQVRHPNILTIYDYGEIENTVSSQNSHTAFIAMEYIPGNTLRFTMAEDGLDDVPDLFGKWIRRYFLPILDGVEVLHTNTIVHRDLKPENIFMDGEVPKIADFGLSRSYQMKAVTSSIEMLGTLAYMSPEQCADFKNSDSRTDIYALGKMLFEAVHGTLTEKTVPFTAVSLENPQSDFLIEMNAVISKATRENLDERYQSVQELRADVQKALATLGHENGPKNSDSAAPQFRERSSIKEHKWLVGAIVITLIFVAAMTVYHLVDRKEPTGGVSSSSDIHREEVSDEPEAVLLGVDEKPAPSILGRDGSRMILTGITDGVGEDPLFYIDEEKITNFLFVEFLNNLGNAVTVESGVVRFDERILYYSGGGAPGEDSIVYQHNTFHLSDQKYGNKPVVRVTYHGAHLFAVTHGKDLLAADEWQYAFRFHQKNKPTEKRDIQAPAQQSSMSMMHSAPAPPPEVVTEPEVLDDMGKAVKEWVRVREEKSDAGTEKPENVYESGVFDAERVMKNQEPLRRLPWEGFDDVGFRTKTPIRRK